VGFFPPRIVPVLECLWLPWAFSFGNVTSLSQTGSRPPLVGFPRHSCQFLSPFLSPPNFSFRIHMYAYFWRPLTPPLDCSLLRSSMGAVSHLGRYPTNAPDPFPPPPDHVTGEVFPLFFVGAPFPVILSNGNLTCFPPVVLPWFHSVENEAPPHPRNLPDHPLAPHIFPPTFHHMLRVRVPVRVGCFFLSTSFFFVWDSFLFLCL